MVIFMNWAIRLGVTGMESVMGFIREELNLICFHIVAVMSHYEPERYLRTAQRFKATVLHLVPPIILMLAKSPLG